jgi:uncharacterized protein YciI
MDAPYAVVGNTPGCSNESAAAKDARRRGHIVGLLAAALTAACHGQSPPPGAAASPSFVSTEPTYLVLYRPGPKWTAAEPFPEPLRQHFRYLLSLHQRGALILAGPFGDAAGGAAVLTADDDAAALQLLRADPAVQSDTFQFELHPWRWVDWKAHAAQALK